MQKLKKAAFFVLGFVCLAMAYVGLVTPGIPYSPFIVASAYCFARSSERMHRWIMNHRIFGPFLRNWSERRVFPTKLRYLMLAMMSLSLILMYTSGVKPIGIVSTAVFMALVAVWAWRYPATVEEHDARKQQGRRIGWFK